MKNEYQDEYQKKKRRSININIRTKAALDSWIISQGELLSYDKAIQKLIRDYESK